MKKRLAVLLAGLFSFGLISIANATPVTIPDPGMDYGLGRYINYDILSVTGDFDSSNVYLSFLLDKPPVLSGGSTNAPYNEFCGRMGIDTDRNPLTGNYTISANGSSYPVEAELMFCSYNGNTVMGFGGAAGWFEAATTVNGSRITVAIPFTDLGISNGLVDFVVVGGNSPDTEANHCRIEIGEEVSDIARGTTDPYSAPTPAPEPASILLLGSGLVGMLGIRRKKA